MNLDDNPVDAYHRGIKEGADRERARIRRALLGTRKMIQEKRKLMWGTKASAWLLTIVNDIDAATRKRRK